MQNIGNQNRFSGRSRSRTIAQRSENDLVPYAVMSLAVLLLSMPLPLVLSGSPYATGFCWAACAVCALLVILTSQRIVGVFAVSLIFTFAISYFGDPVLIATVIGIIFSCGLYSAAIAAANKSHIFFLAVTPLLPATLTYLITDSPTFACVSMLHTIPALAMGLGARRKASRTQTIAIFSTVGVILMAASALLYIYGQNNALTPEIISDSAEYLRGTINSLFDVAIKNAEAAGVADALTLLTNDVAIMTVNLLPSLAFITAIAVGFFAQKVEVSLFKTYDKEDLLLIAKDPITVSCTSALVFLAAYLLSFTTSASNTTSFLGVVALNISLILFPALIAIGFRAMTRLPRKLGFLALIIWIAIILIANSLSASILTVLALIGAFYIVIVHTDSWAKDHYAKKGEDQ